MIPEQSSGLAPLRKKRSLYQEEDRSEAPPAFDLSGSTHAGVDALVARDEFPEETRSVCSISNHMAQLGRDSAAESRTILVGNDSIAPDNDVSANNTGSSSTLDARIQALSDMTAEERCNQLNQDAITVAPSETPMEAEFLNCTDDEDSAPAQDHELQTLLQEATARNVVVENLGDSEMPELEGSEIDFEGN